MWTSLRSPSTRVYRNRSVSSKGRALRRHGRFLLPHTPLACPPTSRPVLFCLVPFGSGSFSPTPGLPDCFGATLHNAKLPLCVTGSTLPTQTYARVYTQWPAYTSPPRSPALIYKDHAQFLLTCLIVSCHFRAICIIAQCVYHAFFRRKCKVTWPFLPG